MWGTFGQNTWGRFGQSECAPRLYEGASYNFISILEWYKNIKIKTNRPKTPKNVMKNAVTNVL